MGCGGVPLMNEAAATPIEKVITATQNLIANDFALEFTMCNLILDPRDEWRYPLPMDHNPVQQKLLAKTNL